VSSSSSDTIVAAATPVGRSALAIVRIDGPGAAGILTTLGGREGWEPRRATLVRLREGEEAIDEAIAILFVAPESYTGNDLVEITLHGSPVAVNRLIEAAIREGARMAEPGEFTERAVLNGKLDLVQAEAVVDLIHARTDLQARLSLANLEGALSGRAKAIRESLVDLISRLEAALDFAEEGYEFITREEVAERIVSAIGEADALLETARRGRATNEGLTAVILGRPNAGKSTLLNALCGLERAIVTPVAGTTRDLLRETLVFGGLPVTVVDTAGLREARELVEEIGIRRTREAAEVADLALYLIDASEGITAEDERELATLQEPRVVWTKSDLAAPPEGALGISAMTGEGLGDLVAVLDRWVEERWAVPEGSTALVNRRQREAMGEVVEALGAARGALADGMSEEMLLVDLNRAARAVGTLTGAISHEEMMEAIFSRFCIGK
jgi:tRNA modification GTPase